MGWVVGIGVGDWLDESEDQGWFTQKLFIHPTGSKTYYKGNNHLSHMDNNHHWVILWSSACLKRSAFHVARQLKSVKSCNTLQTQVQTQSREEDIETLSCFSSVNYLFYCHNLYHVIMMRDFKYWVFKGCNMLLIWSTVCRRYCETDFLNKHLKYFPAYWI